MIMCDINNDEFTFKFKDPPTFVTNERCAVGAGSSPLIFRWTSKESTILDREFNFTNVFRYITYYYNTTNTIYVFSILRKVLR